jgi:Ni2+-binding GTPase involved in maturation of urease and hydrogenase
MRVSPSQLEKDAQKINPHVPFIKINALKEIGIPRVIEALGLRN